MALHDDYIKIWHRDALITKKEHRLLITAITDTRVKANYISMYIKLTTMLNMVINNNNYFINYIKYNNLKMKIISSNKNSVRV